MFYKRWNPEEDKVLKKYYGIKPNHVLSELLCCSESAIRNRACKLKITKPQNYSESIDRLDDEFDGGTYYRRLDYAKTLDNSINYVSDAWSKYGREEFELMFKNYCNG